MERKGRRGKFIVLEGLDGAGTTTQGKRLAGFLEESNQRVFLTCEPTNSPIGQLIRRVLKGNLSVSALTLADLFVADRREHLWGDQGIMDFLEEGGHVVCDRYIDSSLAYQSEGCGFDLVLEKNREFPVPDYLIFLDIPPGAGIKRIESRKTEKEIFENYEYLEKVSRFYKKALSVNKKDVKVLTLDGTETIDAIHKKIVHFLFSHDQSQGICL